MKQYDRRAAGGPSQLMPGRPHDLRGPFRRLWPVPGVTTYGIWEPATWERDGKAYNGFRLVPAEPPWRGLFAALDGLGRNLPDGPVTLEEEANAIVACCFRYGSYAHVLTAGEAYPPFRVDPGLSRISDSEMKRINVEFSSGLAVWLEDARTDPGKVCRRVRAALSALPGHWQRGGGRLWSATGEIETLAWVQGLDFAVLANASRDQIEAWPVREEANAVVHWAYRQMDGGCLERLHEGRASAGRDIPGYQRLYASEVNAICRSTAGRIGIHLLVQELGHEGSRRAHQMLLGTPCGWSTSEETAPVSFAGTAAPVSLAPRLEALAGRCPAVYGAVARAVCEGRSARAELDR